MNSFKKIIFPILLLTALVSNAQTNKIDELIKNVDNKEVYVLVLDSVSPRIKENSNSNKILQIGQEITPSLIKILDYQNKGIAAHIILSKIWKNKWPDFSTSYIIRDQNGEVLVISGLKIHVVNDKLYCTSEDLKRNKIKWQKFLQA